MRTGTEEILFSAIFFRQYFSYKEGLIRSTLELWVAGKKDREHEKKRTYLFKPSCIQQNHTLVEYYAKILNVCRMVGTNQSAFLCSWTFVSFYELIRAGD